MKLMDYLDCDGTEIIAQGGAPYEDCVVLPDNYVIIMNDSWGDGWNGNDMIIGDNIYSLEYGPENVVAVGIMILIVMEIILIVTGMVNGIQIYFTYD